MTAPLWAPLLVAAIALVWSATSVVGFVEALALLWTIGLGLAAVGLRYPRLGLVGIGLLCSLHGFAAPLLLRGGLWRWNTVNYLLFVMTFLFWPYLLGVGKSQSRVLLALIALLGLEILLSPDPQDGIQHVFSVVAVFGLLVYVGRATLDPDLWYWLGVVTGVSAAVGTAAFLLQQGRLPFVNPNAWSYVPLTAVFAISLAFVVTGGARGRGPVLGLLATINGLWVFLSGSRGSILTAAVCLTFLFTLMQLRRALWFGMVAALLSVVILSQFTALRERAVGRLGLLADRNQSLTVRTSGRFDLALGAWHMFQDHPFGLGTGGFRANWVDYVADTRAREGSSQFQLKHSHLAAHSAWMKILVENGFPGIVLLGAYVFSFAVSGWSTRDPVLRKLGLTVSAVLAVAWISTEFWNPGLWLLAAGATVLIDRYSLRRLSASAHSIA